MLGGVCQFDLPRGAREFESYTHRVGRTGRAGRSGVATAFFVPGEAPKVGDGELWPLLKASFDGAGAPLPAWFAAEAGKKRGKPRAKVKGPPPPVRSKKPKGPRPPKGHHTL